MTDQRLSIQLIKDAMADGDQVFLIEDVEVLLAEIERLQAFVDAFDEMDKVQPYDGYYMPLIEKVWAARAALEHVDF